MNKIGYCSKCKKFSENIHRYWCRECRCQALNDRRRKLGILPRKFKDELFDERIRRTDTCWIYTGRVTKNGYGELTPKIKAHRYAYERAFGAIPKGKIICHKCNNKLCVNPQHLYVGTSKDNYKDLRKSGWKPKLHKLTEQEKVTILNSTESHTALGRKFGVSYQAIRSLRNRNLAQI